VIRSRVALVSSALVVGCAPPIHDAARQAPRESHAVAASTDDEMAHLPAGPLLRGHLPALRPDEGPPHTVSIHAFAIDRTLVTRRAFGVFVDATGYVTTAEQTGYGIASREGMRDWEWERVPHASWRRPFIEEDEDSRAFLNDDAPVVMVSWYDAVAYCDHEGKRLPTEAEWEYAMRAGSENTRFPWGDSPERDGRLGLNFWQGESHEHNLREDGFVYVSPVHAFQPNAWGIYDPVGNVWQWTADWYGGDTFAREAARGDGSEPVVVETGTLRVARGGSWWCGACTCDGYGLFYRAKSKPEAVFNNNGFRCAR
jgi:sulfatase modifying factor 1